MDEKVALAIFGTAFYFIAKAVCMKVLCMFAFFRTMDADRSHRFVLYILSQVNAVITTSICSYLVGTGNESNTAAVHLTIALILGYFIHDFVATYDSWHKHKVDCFHHMLGITVCGGFLYFDNPVLRPFIPRFGLVEASTIFLNGTWFLRELHMENTLLYRIVGFLFVLAFFCVRVVYLPYLTIYGEFFQPEVVAQIRIPWNAIWAACGLQFYWFGLILKRVVPSKKNSDEDKFE